MPRVTLSEPFELSDAGSTRATAYHMTNKAVRIGQTTHVTWLDAVAGVRVRSFDHATSQWSATLALDEGCDNHTNPALSAAPDGRLRIAYGPHSFWDPLGRPPWNHGRFKLQQTLRPNDSTQWEGLSNAGYGGTYASLNTDLQGRDHLVYRGGVEPQGTFYERRLPGLGWDLTTKLSVQRIPPGYTFTGSTLTIAPDGTLFCGFEYYRLRDNRSLGVCGLKSTDGGETWTSIDGRPARLPAEYSDALAIPHHGDRPSMGGLAIDTNRDLLALTHDEGASQLGMIFNRLHDGRWESQKLASCLPGWDLQRGNMTVDAQGRILIAATAVAPGTPQAERWGHASCECFLLASYDRGQTFEATPVSKPFAGAANWLATLSLPGPSRDMSTPLVLYTQGGAGAGCAPGDKTRVFAVWVG
ncbi:MAG: hypothetical protein NTW19_24730 [Planctomycetota bacterium]|nr:hypothetical protein [Planctomycetota bacterium]